MGPHLKKSNPEVWAEMLAICQEAANAGDMPPEAFKRVRHIGFGYETWRPPITAISADCGLFSGAGGAALS
jgi:hypothetical protein